MKRKIAILGFGDTVKDCPWQDESWELWAMNGFWRAAEPDYGVKAPESRYALWFDMHTVAFTREYGKHAGIGDAQERWLEKEHPFPVLMLDTDPAFPSVKRFPLEAVVEKVGRPYFTSTVAYALALALVQGDVAEVGLWGIDLIHDSEYIDQRPCAEYWIAKCEAAGIKVTIHPRSALLSQRCLYGYEDPDPLADEMGILLQQNIAQLEKTCKEAEAAMEDAKAKWHTNQGALQAMREMLHRIHIVKRGGRV